MIALADDAPKSKLPFTVKTQTEPKAKPLDDLDTPFGKVNATIYVGMQPEGSLGAGMLFAVEYALPEKYAKSKPEAIYTILETEIKKTMKIEKSVAIKIGKDPARDVVHAHPTPDPKVGKSMTRERWVLRNGRLYIFRALWSEKGDGAEWSKKLGHPFIESVAFP
jgi:hypothetical protein